MAAATPDGLKFNLDELVIEMASLDPMRLPYVDYVKQMLSTIDHTPDHPVYPVMIHDAIVALDEDGGSTKDAISEFIVQNYDVLPVVHPAKLIQQLNKLVKEEQVVLTSEDRYMLPVDNASHAKSKKAKMHLKKHRKCRRTSKLSKGDGRNRISEAHNLNIEVDNELQIEETDGPPGFTNAICLQDGQIKAFVEEKPKVTEKTKVLDGKPQLQRLDETFNGPLNYEVNRPKASVIEGFEIDNLSLQERMVLSENQGLGTTAEGFSQVSEGNLELVEEGGFCVVKPASIVDKEMPAEIIQGRREEIEALEEQSQQQRNALKNFKDRMEFEDNLIVTEEILQIEQHPGCEERSDSPQPRIQESFHFEEHSQPEQVHVTVIEAAEEQSQLQEQASVTEEGFCILKLGKGIDDQRLAEEVQEGQEQIEAIEEQSQQQGNALESLKVQVEVEHPVEVTEEVLRIKYPESKDMKGHTQPQVQQRYHDEGHSQFEKLKLIDVVETGEQSRLQEQVAMEMNDQFEANCQIKGTEELCYVEHSENEINEYEAQNHILRNLHVDKHPQLEQMHSVENEATEEQWKLQQQTFKIIHGSVEAQSQVQVTEELYQVEHYEDTQMRDENLPEVECNFHAEDHLQSEQLQGAGEADNYRILQKQAPKVTNVEEEADCEASEEPHDVDCLGNRAIIGKAQPCVQHGAGEYSQSDKWQNKMTNNQGRRQQPNFEVAEQKKSQHEQQNYLRNKINGHSNMAEILSEEPQQYEDMSLISSPCTSHKLDHAISSLSLLPLKDKLLDLLERTRGIEQEIREMIACLPAMEMTTNSNQNPKVRAVPKIPEYEHQILPCPAYVQADSMQHDQNQETELPSHQTSPDVEMLACEESFQEQRQHVVSAASLVPGEAQGLDLTVKQDIVHDKAKTYKSEFVKEKQLEKSDPEVSNENDQNPEMGETPVVFDSECQIRMCLVHAQVDSMQHEQNQEINLPNHQRSPDEEILPKECLKKQGEDVELETSVVPHNARGIDLTVKQLSQLQQLQQDIVHDKAKMLESEFVKEQQLKKSDPGVSYDNDQNPEVEEIPLAADTESECRIRFQAQVDSMLQEQNQAIELHDHQTPEGEILSPKECFQKPRDHVEPEATPVPQNAERIDLTVKQLSPVQLQQDILNGRAKMPKAELAEEQQLETSFDKNSTEIEMMSAQQPCRIEQEMQLLQLQLQDQSPSKLESGNHHVATYDPLSSSGMPPEPQKMVMVDTSFQPEKQCLARKQKQGKPQLRQLRPRCPRPSESHSYNAAAGANRGSLQLSSSGSRRKHKLEPPIHKRPQKQRPRVVEEPFLQEQEVSHQKKLEPQQELGSDTAKTQANEVQDQPPDTTKAEFLPHEQDKERNDEPLNRRCRRSSKPKPDVHIAGREEEQSLKCVKLDDDKPPATRSRGMPQKDARGLCEPPQQLKWQKKQPQDRGSR